MTNAVIKIIITSLDWTEKILSHRLWISQEALSQSASRQLKFIRNESWSDATGFVIISRFTKALIYWSNLWTKWTKLFFKRGYFYWFSRVAFSYICLSFRRIQRKIVTWILLSIDPSLMNPLSRENYFYNLYHKA